MANMRALIIEDDKTSQTLLANILKPYATVAVAEDGDEGFQQFSTALESEQPFDIILLDLNMPWVDGNTVLTAIRELEEEHGRVGTDAVKVIVTTSDQEPKSLYQATGNGCSAYLIKPIHREQLRDELRRLNFMPDAH